MKKILSVISILFASLILVSCQVNKYDDHYIVVFYTNGIVSIDTIQVEKNTKIEEPDFEQIEGIEFLGWYKDRDYNEEFEFDKDIVDKSMTLYAKWEFEEIVINYHLESDAINHPDNPKSYTWNDKTITLKNPTREGYRFISWHTSPNFSNENRILQINPKLHSSDLDLYARWRKV